MMANHEKEMNNKNEINNGKTVFHKIVDDSMSTTVGKLFLIKCVVFKIQVRLSWLGLLISPSLSSIFL